MSRHSTLILLPLLLALATGCGPIRSTVGIIQAEQVLKEARELGVEQTAPYPMAVAQELVAKAIEEQGYADYSTSWQLATEARDLVQAALDALPRADGVPEPPIRVDEYDGLDEPADTDPGRRVMDEDEEVEAILEEADEARKDREAEEAEREFEGEDEDEVEEPEEPEEEPTPSDNPWLDTPEESP